MSDSVVERLQAAFPDAEFTEAHGQEVAHVAAPRIEEFLTAVRDEGFDMFVDLCGVDYLTRTPRFEVVVNVLSLGQRRRLRIRAGVPGDDPVIPSITGVYPGANFFEREAYDLFGIRFEGHPDLTRILLPDDWEGHPLRKDTPVGAVPVQFKGSHQVS